MSGGIPEALIDFANVPGNIISGLSTEEFERVAAESMRSNCSNSEEVVDLTDEQREILCDLEKSNAPLSTSKQTRLHVDKFRNFLRTKELTVNFENVPNETLNDYLRLFYSALVTKDGNFYSPSSLICVSL